MQPTGDRGLAGRFAKWFMGMDGYSLAAFGLPLLVYLLTLAPTVYNLDSAELTTAAATAGITRATGYPLYLSLGFLWSHLPLGDVGYRMNLLSAVSAALTIGLCERILRRLGVRAAARLAALGLLAFSKFFWAEALIAEVYTFQTALMAGMILLALRWSERPTPARLGLLGLGVGLGLSHHLATLLLLPGLTFFIFGSHPRKAMAWKSVLFAALGGAAGLSFYLYLPLRALAAPAFNYAGGYDELGIFHPANLTSLSGLWWLVTGQSFAPLMFAFLPGVVWQEFLSFCAQLVGVFFAVGIGPGILGVGFLLKRQWKVAGMLLLMLLGHLAFYLDYQVLDKNLMFLPVYLLWALWLGVGYEVILSWFDADLQTEAKPTPRLSRWILPGTMAAICLFALAWNWPLVDLSHDTSTRQRGEDILAAAGEHALIFGYWDTVPIIQYLQLVEGKRPDVQAINRFMISPENLVKLINREISARPIYINSLPAGLPPGIELIQKGALYQLRIPD